MASKDLWKSVVAGFSTPHLADTPPPRIQFVAEYRLGFGLAINSNVAQRLSNLIIHVFLQEFHHLDRAYYATAPVCVQHWLQHRERLSSTTGRW